MLGSSKLLNKWLNKYQEPEIVNLDSNGTPSLSIIITENQYCFDWTNMNILFDLHFAYTHIPSVTKFKYCTHISQDAVITN